MQNQQAASELAVFKKFLLADGAPTVRAGSVESRSPPEPDIMCQLDEVGTYAFELVELVEARWAQLVSDQIRMEDRLYQALAHTDSAYRRRMTEAFGDALLYIRYATAARVKDRIRMIGALFDFLLRQAHTIQGDISVDVSTELGTVVRSIGITRRLSDGPYFQVEVSESIGDPTLDLIRAKWTKRYTTDHAIDLLAYYELHPTIPVEAWILKLKSFLQANWNTSPFAGVWVFDVGSNTILFMERRPVITD